MISKRQMREFKKDAERAGLEVIEIIEQRN